MVICSRIGIPHHFSLLSPWWNRGGGGVKRFISISHTVTGRFSRHSAKWLNPQHFGSDPADIRIRNRINPEIHIRMPDHSWWRLDALAEVCACWPQSSVLLVLCHLCRLHNHTTSSRPMLIDYDSKTTWVGYRISSNSAAPWNGDPCRRRVNR